MDPNSKIIKSTIGFNNKLIHPFYEPPQHQKTSAEIINEARVAIKESSQMGDTSFSASLKPINTQRPFTPRDKQRILFGKNKQTKSSRPPSSFSLRYLQFETPDTNVTNKKEEKTRNVRSNSISEINNEKIFNLNVKDLLTHKIKLPSLENNVKTKRKLFPATSLSFLPEEYAVNPISEIQRNAFSSPKERTDFDTNPDSPFGHPSKSKLNKNSLILGPQNLDKIFENKQIVQDSEKLFIKKNYWAEIKKQQITPENNESFFELTIDEILNRLNNVNNNDEKTMGILDELYECLDRNKLFGSKITSKMKILTLKSLYKQVESQNEELLLKVARIILALRVTGNNLSGVCKLVFKVSRNDKNDSLFTKGNILELFVEALGRSSPLDDAEACVYGYGAIKFLTMNPVLLEKILNLGILQLMVLHIKMVNAARNEKTQTPEQTNHALYQLTGALRNLASEDKMFDSFVTCGVVTELCQTMDLFNSDIDIVSNIARTLSKKIIRLLRLKIKQRKSCIWVTCGVVTELCQTMDYFNSDIDIVSNIARTLSIISTNDNCCSSISEYKNIYKVFIILFNKYPGKEKIIVRLGYMMGNLVAKLDEARSNFFNEENSIDCLINALNIYLQKYLNVGIKKEENGNEENQLNIKDASADVIVKIVRIIANTAINSDIGQSLIEIHGINLIEIFLMILFTKSIKDNKELVLSVLSTLNNLSYYYSTGNDNDAFHIKQIDLSKALCGYINCESKDCTTEAVRVLGNLSRSRTTRDYILKSGSFRNLIDVLDKDDMDLLHTTMGVFVNLMADFQSRIIFKEYSGINKLIRILQTYGEIDWSLSMLTCQVIWNYCIDSTNLNEVFEGNEIEDLLCVLAEYLDEEKLFGITGSQENIGILNSQEYIIWDEFANVATNLLEKIETFLDNIDPIEITSYSDDEDLCIPQPKRENNNIKIANW